MKDSQQSKKQKRFFKRKKESNAAPLKSEAASQVKYVEQPAVEIELTENQEASIKPSTEAQVHGKQEKEDTNFSSRFSVVSRRFFSFSGVRQRFKLKTVKQIDRLPKTDNREPKNESLFKQLEVDLQLALIPLILLAILSILMLINNHFLQIIATNKSQDVGSIADIQPLPLAENAILPDLSAKAAIVLDTGSQVILMSKNPDLRFSMASTTKIMTAVTALTYFKPDDVLTVKSYGVEGSGLGLTPGEQFTFKDLLYAMLLPSANDAAVAVADNYPGGKEAFVKKMNENALILHLTNTHYADPAGLNDDGNYTTVVDLSRLGTYAMKNTLFAEVVGTKEKTIYTTNYLLDYPLTNSNKLLGTHGVNGIKTGTTEGAKEVLVTSVISKGHTYIIVVMNSEDRFADTRVLLDFINEKVTYMFPTLPVK
jgi:D-alanyl-D-alanine carboxypeptidase